NDIRRRPNGPLSQGNDHALRPLHQIIVDWRDDDWSIERAGWYGNRAREWLIIHSIARASAHLVINRERRVGRPKTDDGEHGWLRAGLCGARIDGEDVDERREIG